MNTSPLVLNNGLPATYPLTAGGSLVYVQAYFNNNASWSATSSSYTDPTWTGSDDTLTVRQSSGITLTAAASDLPGITFTPASASAVYLITAQLGIANDVGSNAAAVQLTDGTTVIAAVAAWDEGASAFTAYVQTISGIYVPGTVSPVTVKLQLAANSGTAVIQPNYAGVSNSTLEWTVIQLNPPLSPGPTGSYAQAYFDNNANWSTTSTTFTDPTWTGSDDTLNIRVDNIGLSAAASNLPGITFTPASASAVYQITALINSYNPSTYAAFQLTDGTNIINSAGISDVSGDLQSCTMGGIYVPGTSSPVTVKIQMFTNGALGTIQTAGINVNTMEWIVLRIA